MNRKINFNERESASKVYFAFEILPQVWRCHHRIMKIIAVKLCWSVESHITFGISTWIIMIDIFLMFFYLRKKPTKNDNFESNQFQYPKWPFQLCFCVIFIADRLTVNWYLQHCVFNLIDKISSKHLAPFIKLRLAQRFFIWEGFAFIHSNVKHV